MMPVDSAYGPWPLSGTSSALAPRMANNLPSSSRRNRCVYSLASGIAPRRDTDTGNPTDHGSPRQRALVSQPASVAYRIKFPPALLLTSPHAEASTTSARPLTGAPPCCSTAPSKPSAYGTTAAAPSDNNSTRTLSSGPKTSCMPSVPRSVQCRPLTQGKFQEGVCGLPPPTHARPTLQRPLLRAGRFPHADTEQLGADPSAESVGRTREFRPV